MVCNLLIRKMLENGFDPAPRRGQCSIFTFGWNAEGKRLGLDLGRRFFGRARPEGCDAATWDKGVVKKISGVAVLAPTECLPGEARGKNDGEEICGRELCQLYIHPQLLRVDCKTGGRKIGQDEQD